MSTLYELFKTEPFIIAKNKIGDLTGVGICNEKLVETMSFPYILQRSVTANQTGKHETLTIQFNSGEVIIEGRNMGELLKALHVRTLHYVRAMDKKEIEKAESTKTPIISSVVSNSFQ